MASDLVCVLISLRAISENLSDSGIPRLDPNTQLEKLPVGVYHVDAPVPKTRATEEQKNSQQADQAAKMKVPEVDLDRLQKGELFLDLWAWDASGH